MTRFKDGHEYENWHLTPDGWVKGSHRYDPHQEVEVPTPEGSVKTVQWEQQFEGHPGRSKLKTEIFEFDKTTDLNLLDRLEAQYGKRPPNV